MAEVWMDEYAQYLYNHRPHYKNINPGDLTEQKAIREKLKCKPFKWFMTKVAYDLEDYYPPVEPPAFANGEVRWFILLKTSVYGITWNKPVNVSKNISFITNGYWCEWKWETFQHYT